MPMSASFSRRALLCTLVALLLFCLTGGEAARADITASGDVTPSTMIPETDVWIGDQDVGSLRIDGGSTLESGNVTLGVEGVGFATVTGPGSMWSFLAGHVGVNGVGRLNVLDGAIVDAADDLKVGYGAGANGTVVVDGADTVLRLGGDLTVGSPNYFASDGLGLLRVSGGAIVDAPNSETDIDDGGRLELNGGLLRAVALSNNGTIAGQGTLQILSQSVENAGRMEVGTGQRLSVAGQGSDLWSYGVISADGGEIDFSQQVHNCFSYNYPSPAQIILRNSIVRFAPWPDVGLDNESLLVALAGTNDVYGEVLQGSGGQTMVTNGSTLVFHNPVELDEGDLVVHSGSTAMFLSDVALRGTLSVSIGAEDGPTPVQTIGETDIAADLHVSFSQPCSPHVGDVFPLVIGTEIVAEFSHTELPALPFGMVWSLDENSSSIQLRIIATPDGDYNGDGTVDAADYTVWRDTLGSDSYLHADGSGNGLVDNEDYMVWKANFGATAWPPLASQTQGTASLAAVPEPAAGLLLVVGAVLVARRRP